MIPELIPIYITIFLFGIVIGSFLNVCIFRIPNHETVVTERSHCMSCGYQLAWYDMVPVFSWLFLRGKCRKCRQPVSPQYPIIEAANGLVYVLVFAVNDFTLQSVIYCLMMSALLVLAIIDWRNYEIPVSINLFILCLGILQTVLDISNWADHIAGFLCVSIFLYLLLVISRGRAIGGGDVKLMAAAGLSLGWKNIILAFLIGCILGSIIHLLRMKISGADHVLAMGPYLATGIAVAALWGDTLIAWYLSFLL
jgi:leader peptidase (prepilin peptidase)/N-methyltransferase